MHEASVRDKAWDQLGEEIFDLVVVGGGVVGAATARNAALRGLKVALIEADDIASGTSSKSSKLIHGGFRYLEQGDLPLVFESVSERQILMQTVAPHLVRPLGFLFPIYKHDPVRLVTLRLGLFVYEGLAMFRSPKRHKNLTVDEVKAEVPGLRDDGLQGAPLFWDCATDDARITLENVIDASWSGAVVLNHARVVELLRDDEDHVAGVRAVDTLDTEDRQVEVRARCVVNATGPWSDRTRSMTGRDSKQLRLTKGVHLVVPADRISVPHTITGFHPRDQRVLFIIPWGDQVYIGTTDTDYEGDPALVRTEKADVDYLFEAVHHYLPDANLAYDDITATWAGLRALIRAEGVPPSQVSREHVITTDPDGLISVAGGKLTTHRRIGDDAVDHALRWMRRAHRDHSPAKSVDTGDLRLPGAVDWPEGDDGTKVAAQLDEQANGRIPPETAKYLADRYGMLSIPLLAAALDDERLLKPLVPGRPEILGQVDWAVKREFAATVTDFMERRTQLFFRDADQGLGALDVVARRMGELLGWSPEHRERSAQEYRDHVARSRAWRDDPAPPG